MKGGGVARLPVTATTGAELKAEWDMKYVSGHGQLNGHVFLVPENYYIFFVAVAGEPSLKEETTEVLSFIYDYLNKEEKWWTNIHKLMAGKGLFSNVVYNPNSPKPEARSFYEPDDIIQDLALTMKNDHKPVFPVGVFQLPVSADIKAHTDDFNEGDEPLTTGTDKRLYGVKSNLFADAIFVKGVTKTTLFNVIRQLGPTDKKRLLIVDTCRVAPGHNAPTIAQRKGLSRTLSMSGRVTCPKLNLPIVNMETLMKFSLKLIADKDPVKQALAVKITMLIQDLIDQETSGVPVAASDLFLQILADANKAGVVLRADVTVPATAATAPSENASKAPNGNSGAAGKGGKRR